MGAMAESNDPMVKTAMETKKMRFPPKMSPALPASGMIAVPASWLTLKTHPARMREALKSVVICGKATDTEVPLMATSSKDRLVAAKTK